MIKAIVTDIEGTTSSIDFVHQTLFPYAKQHLRRYLHEHGPVAEWIALSRCEIEQARLLRDAAQPSAPEAPAS